MAGDIVKPARNGYGNPLRCECPLPGSGRRIGETFKCPVCDCLWRYTHDNVASCFWVKAGPVKKGLYWLGGGR